MKLYKGGFAKFGNNGKQWETIIVYIVSFYGSGFEWCVNNKTINNKIKYKV